MTARVIRAGVLLMGSALLLAGAERLRQAPERFDHPKHAKLFVTCATCHAGMEEAGAATVPPAATCVACHDGTVSKRVDWTARPGPRVSNLKFDHLRHATLRRAKGDTTGTCADCHADRGDGWMRVRGPTAPQCVGCHIPGGREHLAVPDSACTTCHLTLANAATLPRERIAKFPAPPSHEATGFMLPKGHGAQSKGQSCATCHARDFCAACHVDAPETSAIQALAPDARSLAIPHALKAPTSHAGRDFDTKHGKLAGSDGASCRSCHTQESCSSCHRAGSPAPGLALYAAGPGRGEGARTERRAPASHVPGWKERHGPFAAASMKSCTSCHARSTCLECHRPDASRRNSYHPASYLTRHPADAYTRAASCTDCHNVGEFCQTCHAQAGLSAKRTLLGTAGYHDGNRQFFLGHGQAARQALESCVACHVERDCLTCHSVVRGRGFNPHGPGFDPERMLKKNPQLCIACHGTAIPRR